MSEIRVRVLSEYPMFIITDQGHIRGRSGRWLRPAPNSDGYLLIWFRTGQGKGSVKVHQLVCRAYHGEPPTPAHEVRHLNGVRTDNRAVNLAWGTREENCADRLPHGTHCRAERSGRARLTWEQVRAMRRDHANGRAPVEIRHEYGVTESHLTKILNHSQWRDTEDGRPITGTLPGNRRFTRLQVRAMRVAYAQGARLVDLAREYDARDSSIYKIVNYQQWKKPIMETTFKNARDLDVDDVLVDYGPPMRATSVESTGGDVEVYFTHEPWGEDPALYPADELVEVAADPDEYEDA